MPDSAQRFWGSSRRQPVFNLPPVVIGVLGTLLAIHGLRVWFLDGRTEVWLIETFAFIPLRISAAAAFTTVFPGGEGARVWSFLTYALLHATWGHVLINGLWLAAFGSPLAWRFGTVRFLLFSAVGAIAGAAFHLAFYPQSTAPMVGASAAISAHMAGASRFVFAHGGPLWRGHDTSVYRHPAPPLRTVLTDGRVLSFLGVWFAVNLVFGLSGAGSGLASGAIAWDAHIGGFVVGLLVFPLFDPVRQAG
jgi:membrane associated rhomboid family serine protease